jgi:hypothetical protein
MLKAQKYGLDIQFGHQYGINKTAGYDAPFTSNRRYSMGNGVNRQLMLHFYPDSSNWYMSAGLSYMTGNNVVTAKKENLTAMDYQVATSTLNTLRLIARLSYQATISKFNLTFSAGIILPLSARAKEEFYVRDSVEESKTTSVVRQYTSVGFNGSIGVSRQITPRIRFFINSDINILNHHAKSRKITAYENSRGRTFESVYPDVASREIRYRRDVSEIRNNKDLPLPRFNKNEPTDRLSYRVTDSSIGIQAGFLFLF